MTEQNSYRTILRSSSIIGGAQVINVLASIAKMKAAAVFLGPAGVGLVGLYTNVMQTAAAVSALGLGNVGTRQVAAAHAEGGEVAVGRTRRALFWGSLILALVGAVVFWLLSGPIARFVLGDASLAPTVAWLALGVALTVAAGSQGALLTGMRRIGDLARIRIGSGLIGAALGVAALWVWGEEGLLAMVLVAPAVTFLLGHLYVSRLGSAAGPRATVPELAGQWREMARLGIPFMLSGLITLAGHLTARSIVQRELGTDALGYFQAAWAIGMTYLGFVLAAMGTDYYPRLTAVIRDPVAATRLVNQQTEVALLLCAPVLVAVIGFAPWIVSALYTSEFGAAVEILRWQLLGDVLKVMSWPLGFVLLARGAGGTYVVTEAIAVSVLVLGIVIGHGGLGVTITGISFLAMYVVYLPLVRWLAGRAIGFRWTPAVRAQAMRLLAAAVAVDVAARSSATLGAALGAALAAFMALWALSRISSVSGATGRLGGFARAGEKLTKWVRR